MSKVSKVYRSHLEDQVQLILNGGPREEGPTRGHLVKNASDTPHVDRGRVLGGAQEDVGWPVPEGDHLVGVGLRRHRLGSGEAEVSQLKENGGGLVSTFSCPVPFLVPFSTNSGHKAKKGKLTTVSG